MPKKTPNPQQLKMPKKPSPWLVLLAIVLVFTVISSFFTPPQETGTTNEIPITRLKQNFRDGKYETVQIKGEEVIGVINEGGDRDKAIRLSGETLSDLGLTDPPEGTEVEVISTEQQAFWASLLRDVLPFIIIVGIIVFLMARMTKNAGGPFSFGQSKAKLFDRRKKRTKFSDVAGAHEAKEELMEIVDFLKNPKKYVKMGAKIPRGALLVGPPGTGKTLLARAVAGEANVPFMSISGSEFVEMFVGVGASRVRDLFEKAKKNAPAIIFIDEIDAVGRQRGGTGYGGGHDEREQTLNQILTEMDGFDNETGVIVMAATNRPDVLDKALMRPGRFDRRIIIDRPDVKAREEILQVHANNKPLAKDANLKDIAKITIGFSGADLENVMNEAAILVARENRQKISHDDLSKSVEKVSLGPERKSKIIEPEEKKKIAYHETGHALVAHMLPGAYPVHKVTIVSRGHTGGVTWYLPEDERSLDTKSQFIDRICSALGGYAAENHIYGEVSIGASDDLKKATQMARNMATRYGMSDLGPISFADAQDMAGYEAFGVRGISEEFSRKIDEYVQKTVKECMQKTSDILKKYDSKLHEVAEALLKKEMLSKEEFAGHFKDVDVPPKKAPPEKGVTISPDQEGKKSSPKKRDASEDED